MGVWPGRDRTQNVKGRTTLILATLQFPGSRATFTAFEDECASLGPAGSAGFLSNSSPFDAARPRLSRAARKRAFNRSSSAIAFSHAAVSAHARGADSHAGARPAAGRRGGGPESLGAGACQGLGVDVPPPRPGLSAMRHAPCPPARPATGAHRRPRGRAAPHLRRPPAVRRCPAARQRVQRQRPPPVRRRDAGLRAAPLRRQGRLWRHPARHGPRRPRHRELRLHARPQWPPCGADRGGEEAGGARAPEAGARAGEAHGQGGGDGGAQGGARG